MDAEKCNQLDKGGDYIQHELKLPKVETVNHPNPGLYIEALKRYPSDDSIDKAAERRLVRKLDMRILSLLGICYFFYVRAPAVAQNVAFSTKDPMLTCHGLKTVC